jgi:hypothetical protein
MADYWIQVFNREPVRGRIEKDLVTALQQVHYESLCQQYGVDQLLIAPALAHLELVSGPEGIVPFFVLKYQPGDRAPLVIFQWNTNERVGGNWLGETLSNIDQPHLRNRLGATGEILAIALQPEQLEGFGLLLAYEVARWAALNGVGLVYGLDGTWYRLNRHQAFLPMVEDTQEEA